MRPAPILILAAIILSLAAAAPVIGQIGLTVSTDKSSYRPGETVIVSGTAPANTTVIISVVNPNGVEVDVEQVTSSPQGTYTARIQLPPTVPYPPPPAQPLWIAGTYTVRAYVGAVTASTTFTLTLGGVVTGRVVDELNNPVQGATVTVLQTGASMSTDINGRFTIETGPGNFTLEVTKAGYLRARVNVSVSVGQTVDLGTIRILSIEFVVSQLQQQVASLTAQNQQLAAQLAALQAQLNATAAALATLQAQVANLSSSLSSLAAEFRAAQQALTVALGNISSKLDSLSSDLRTSFSSINATLSAITARLGALDQLNTAVAGLRQDITSLRGDLGGLTSSVNQVASSVNQVSSKVDTLASRLDTVATSLNNAISSAQSALSNAFSQRIGDVSSKIDSLSSSVSGLTVPIIVAVILALLAFVFALLTFLQVRRAMAAK